MGFGDVKSLTGLLLCKLILCFTISQWQDLLVLRKNILSFLGEIVSFLDSVLQSVHNLFDLLVQCYSSLSGKFVPFTAC